MGIIIDKPNKIVEIFVNHFYKISNNHDCSNMAVQTKMPEAIPRVISPEDNKVLNSPNSLEEVRLVVFSMNLDKSLVPDGFQAFFYQKCWDIISSEMWKAIEASRNGGSNLSKINNTFLTLIPKKEALETPGDLIPMPFLTPFIKLYRKF